MTKYGRLIADVVLSSRDHPTAEQVFFRVKEQAPQISLATVYNNLKALVDRGVLKKLSLGRSPDRYDQPRRHDHLVCLKCGGVTDVALPDLTDELRRRIGGEVYAYDLTVHYVCPRCTAAQKDDESAPASPPEDEVRAKP